MERSPATSAASRPLAGRLAREFGLLLVALAFAFVASELFFTSNKARDYYQFWAVGQGLGRPSLTNVYSPEARWAIGQSLLARAQVSDSPHWRAVAQQRPILEPAGTPCLYSVFRLLSRGNYDADYEFYRLVSVLSYAAAVLCLARLLGFGIIASLLFPALFTLFFYPFHLDAFVGNVNQLQLAALTAAIALAWTHRSWCIAAAGGLLGASVCFKPNLALVPLLWLALWLSNRKYARGGAFIAGLVAGALLGFLLPSAVLGPSCSWPEWWQASDQMVLRPLYTIDSFLGTIAGIRHLGLPPGGSARHSSQHRLSHLEPPAGRLAVGGNPKRSPTARA